MTYSGHCHCGAVAFRFESEPLVEGIRCNCSICIRRGNVMSKPYVVLDELRGQPSLYQWGDGDVKFWFCSICGIHPFSEVAGKHRINLGCVDGIDALALPITLIDGRSY
jgi:hypothetical protein